VLVRCRLQVGYGFESRLLWPWPCAQAHYLSSLSTLSYLHVGTQFVAHMLQSFVLFMAVSRASLG
jgi:hypothetical protein